VQQPADTSPTGGAPPAGRIRQGRHAFSVARELGLPFMRPSGKCLYGLVPSAPRK
jgi:hypothetical protein